MIFHLAGVNRPQHPAEFETGNAGLTEKLCRILAAAGPRTAGDSQLLDPGGVRQPLRPEQAARRSGPANSSPPQSGAPIAIFRFKNVFGKWCRPNYNSVVATFCHNMAHDLPIEVSDPGRQLELVHVDDVIAAMLAEMDRQGTGDRSNLPERPERCFAQIGPVPFSHIVAPDPVASYTLTLGDLAGRIQFFREMQQSLRTPDFSVRFNQQLYTTYLSYLEPPQAEYGLTVKCDDRGNLAEFIKSPWFGQIFVSRTRPGVTRGNHYHHRRPRSSWSFPARG